ncbi:uncharacterized protein LTR77_000644 [Saxophila tyrrhenica]|uniref:CENP-V/GFA domain-containing protein n=1 Tax=Saxophila tyrrhenica TaxID=1690608 RepID=A0AAV9PT50_9PEZI|nr:hypothetical protein LTR77_000644 [Saxophila tyrrhenica]
MPTGRCACGDYTYEIAEKPGFTSAIASRARSSRVRMGGQSPYTPTGDRSLLFAVLTLLQHQRDGLERSSASQRSQNSSYANASQYKLLGGQTESWTRGGDSGKEVTNFYCSGCKNLMRVEAGFMPEMYIVKPGTLDDIGVLGDVPVVQEIYTRNRPNCFEALGDVPQKKGAT